MGKLLVIGGGAAGMFAAITAAENGWKAEIFEKNENVGKKLRITGKGRCNLTNDCDPAEFLKNVCTNSKFLYSAIYGWTCQDMIDYFESRNMKTKVERGRRVFPASDHAYDVIAALKEHLKELKVPVYCDTKVKKILTEGPRAVGIELENGKKVKGDAVLIAAGGLSYPITGSTGDGLRMAKELGHEITECTPALSPMNIMEDEAKKMAGLSLRNVRVTILDREKKLYEDFGEMMFTHFGVTGPLILSGSSIVGKRIMERKQEEPYLTLSIDLKPALTPEQLDARILRDFSEAQNKQFKNAIGGLFPAKLIPVMIQRSGIDPEKRVNEITREERSNFANEIKNFRLTVTSLRDYNESIITRGGVNVKEVSPHTMESKLISGLYFAGEVLDLDALTGGYNLQIAWATARAAGLGVTRRNYEL